MKITLHDSVFRKAKSSSAQHAASPTRQRKNQAKQYRLQYPSAGPGKGSTDHEGISAIVSLTKVSKKYRIGGRVE